MTKNISERAVRDALKAAPTLTEAAMLLGVARGTLYKLIERYGIEIRRIVL